MKHLIAYQKLKRLELLLPAVVRQPLRTAWRAVRGTPEEHIAAHLSDPLKIAIDVGASTGFLAGIFAKHARACLAFEPNPASAAVLQRKYSPLQVSVHVCALSNSNGQMMLRVPVVEGKERYSLGTVEADNKLAGIPTRSFTIPCRRLDTFDLPSVGVIKIDVEGHELAVLEGAQILLLKDHPSLMIEAEERHRPGTVREISSYLANFGYLGFFLVGRRLRPIAEFDVARYQNAESISLSEVLPGYVYANNFVFVKSIESVSQLLNRTL